MNTDLLRLREDRVHGLPTYPVSIYEVSETDGKVLFDCHWHDELEFILITEGIVRVQLDISEYELRPGQAVFVNSGILHGAFSGDPAGRCSLYSVVFHPEFLASRNNDILQQQYLEPLIRNQFRLSPIFRGTTDAEQTLISHLQAIIKTNIEQEAAYEMITKSRLYMMLALMLADRKPTSAPSRSEALRIERLKQVLSYIHRHYQEPIRIKDLAEELNMSEEHFCRFFKKMMKRSAVSYINEYRMQQAKMLLTETDSKILDVALQVGFDNLSYFITVFKQHHGITPSQYRKLHA
ncbi:putative HTH-type transcriptional regulator YdeC [Insulibacter thermoxylanivorax]|uniref:HTH-type transcriptional regulator YdeC n=1 Tax=Insulibacter thermoxylanivorax TaxID=2749268 RepID=A0A916VEU7_9BACL|nr:AraC family transcriptional regulator [Insulibacter thermoxylanivorax]GFR37133.1 putative HTH-type transcriptional regulator YdeC [Insulibacter thermoxylanivorax]